jgi:hypothetical protein
LKKAAKLTKGDVELLGVGVEAALERALAVRLQDLEAAYIRARGPKQRRKLERLAVRLKREYDAVVAKGKVVNLTYERWRRDFEKALEEALQ